MGWPGRSAHGLRPLTMTPPGLLRGFTPEHNHTPQNLAIAPLPYPCAFCAFCGHSHPAVPPRRARSSRRVRWRRPFVFFVTFVVRSLTENEELARSQCKGRKVSPSTSSPYAFLAFFRGYSSSDLRRKGSQRTQNILACRRPGGSRQYHISIRSPAASRGGSATTHAASPRARRAAVHAAASASSTSSSATADRAKTAR